MSWGLYFSLNTGLEEIFEEIQNTQTLAGSSVAAVELIACMEVCLHLCGSALFVTEFCRNPKFLVSFPTSLSFRPSSSLCVYVADP